MVSNKTIKYPFECRALTLNGSIKQSGLYVSAHRIGDKQIINIMPVNSRGSISRAWIEIPADSIDDLIKFLIDAKYERLT